MAGTVEGGLTTAQRIKEKDPDHYRKIALKAQESWARNGRKPRGFATMDPELRREMGRKGGTISRRTYVKSKKLGPINETELKNLETALKEEANVVYSK